MTWVRLGVGILLAYYSCIVQADENFVRVRISKFNKAITLQGLNLQSPQFKKIDSPLIVRRKLSLQRILKENNWIWKITDLKTKQIEYSKSSQIDLSGEFVEINHHLQLPSDVRLVAKTNRIDLILKLEMEDYLAGVLPNEMPLAWPVEALKAQAVASRSYTLSVLNERKHLHFDVEDTVDDQVYSWFPMANYSPQWKKKILHVLNVTRGEYLSYNGIENYRAYFHADSGGLTESANFVWSSVITQPSFSVLTTYKKSPNQKWIRSWSQQELTNWLRISNNKIKDIKVLSRTPSGRVEKMRVDLERGGEQIFSGQDFRKLMGYSRLKSTWFDVRKNENNFTFVGKGFGHGVGMDQWGARYLALQGKDYHEILKHYYPKTTLRVPSSLSSRRKLSLLLIENQSDIEFNKPILENNDIL